MNAETGTGGMAWTLWDGEIFPIDHIGGRCAEPAGGEPSSSISTSSSANSMNGQKMSDEAGEDACLSGTRASQNQ
jgi:hypothetical protein